MKIIECKEIMGGKAHAVKLDNGVEATAWNDKINAGELMQAWSTKADVEVELKAYTSKAGKSGTNLVGFKILGENQVEVTNTDGSVGNVEVNKGKATREISIIAQCLVKAVFSQPCNFAQDFKGIEQAVVMYKRALEMLNE